MCSSDLLQQSKQKEFGKPKQRRGFGKQETSWGLLERYSKVPSKRQKKKEKKKEEIVKSTLTDQSDSWKIQAS